MSAALADLPRPANAARGDVALPIGQDTITLRLTLGVLAELESAFELDRFEALEARLRQMSAQDMLIVLSCLSGGGGRRILPEALATHPIDPTQAARAIALCFERAGA
jgi:Phage tail tube protein, GTA-gp10